MANSRMESVSENQAAATARGLTIKRNNALTALGLGGGLALLAAVVFPSKPIGLLPGLLIGLLYANAFEYLFHRLLLHLGRGYFGDQHNVHHSTWGGPDEALYVNFTRTPWGVVGLFLLNAIPFALVEWLLGAGVLPGVLVAFAVYFIAFEEMHWRIHLGRLPTWLEFARRHHLTHHARAEERFNVFLPVCDWLLGSGND